MIKKSFILGTAVLFFEISIAIAQVKFCAVGDILLDRGIRRMINKKGVNRIFEGIKAIISSQDLAFCNLECPVHPETIGRAQEKKYCFRGDPESLIAMKIAGLNIMCVANNHSLDWGTEGFSETLRLLNENDIFIVGGGKSHSEAIKPVFIEKNGLTFAFLGVVDFLMESVPRQSNKPAPAYAAMEQLTAEIIKVNNKVDFIIVSFHWGEENSHIPNSRQVAYAHQVIDAGADLVLGHHPHVLQSIECYKDRLILYSLGNFIFDNPRLPQRQTIIFSCEFQKGKIVAPKIHPIMIEEKCPQPASAGDSKKIFELIERISKNFGAKLASTSNFFDLIFKNTETTLHIPIKEWNLKGSLIQVYTNKLGLTNIKTDISSSYNTEDKKFSVHDACLIQDSVAARICAIIYDSLSERGNQLAVFPLDLEKQCFNPPLIDSHDYFNPWKIRSGDIDGDGYDEILVGANRYLSHLSKQENQLFVYNCYGDMIYPKLFGSTLGYPFIDFESCNINEDKKYELIALVNDQTEKSLVISLEWSKFGFNTIEVLDSDYKFNNLLDFLKNMN